MFAFFHYQLISISDVLLQFLEGRSLAEYTRDFS